RCPCQEETRARTLSAAGGTEDGPGAEAVVVVVRWSDFVGSECVSGLSAETAVKAPEEVWRWGYVCQGLLTWRRALSARWAEQDPWARAPGLLLHSHSPQTLALTQGLQGDRDLLLFDLYWQQFGEGESWGKQRRSAGTQIERREDESGGTVSDVDVDEVLGVEGVNKALTRSHDGGRKGSKGAHHPTYRK
ncbi:hypothetical protein POSPLADRAFT_1148678, partial [Postia placenta MAD-698-R-SB12]